MAAFASAPPAHLFDDDHQAAQEPGRDRGGRVGRQLDERHVVDAGPGDLDVHQGPVGLLQLFLDGLLLPVEHLGVVAQAAHGHAERGDGGAFAGDAGSRGKGEKGEEEGERSASQ